MYPFSLTDPNILFVQNSVTKSTLYAVQVRMCSKNQAHHQYRQGCAVLASTSSSFGTGGHYLKVLSNE